MTRFPFRTAALLCVLSLVWGWAPDRARAEEGQGAAASSAAADSGVRQSAARIASVLEKVESAADTEGALRVDYRRVAPGAVQAMLGVENYLRSCGLEKSLLTLIKMRASQINGCAYCLDMHSKEAHTSGESEERLKAIATWRDATCFTPRERAALAWTEALTLVSQGNVTDQLFQETHRQFSDEEMVNLSMAIISINGWNRLNIGFRNEPTVCPVP